MMCSIGGDFLKALDLFCCGGGASVGLYQAGFDVVGIDIEPQKNYLYVFHQSDALSLPVSYLQMFDFIWASPPCQKYTPSAKQWRKEGKVYPDLIQATRELLKLAGRPYCIENVEDAPLINPVMLCGTMFGLKTYRHRIFETNFKVVQPAHQKHAHKNAKMGRPPKENEYLQIVGHFSGVPMAREIMGLPHLNQYELAQAVPPAYSRYIAEQFLKHISYCA